MSEEKFKRSGVGHDANDLHKHGGLDAPEEKTERENLEEAIEALNDSEETENLVDIEKDMKGEDIEIIEDNAEEEKAVEEEPEEEKANEEPSDEVKAALEEIENDEVKEPVKEAEPENNWKTKAENQAYMTIDEVSDPSDKKKKGGAGWKIATVFFLLLAVAGCGAAAYLFFNDGKVELAGRTVESYKTDAKKKQQEEPENCIQAVEEGNNEIKKNEIVVKDLGVKLSLPEDKTFTYTRSEANGDVLIGFYYVSSGYTQFPNFGNPYAEGSAPNLFLTFTKKDWEGTMVSEYHKVGKIGDTFVYYETPQAIGSNVSQAEEMLYVQSATEIENLVKDLKNYSKIEK